MSGMLSAPDFTSRVPIQFLSADAPTLSVTGANALFNNPKTFFVQPGSVAKIEMGINGTTYFRGDGEYAPFAIELEWSQLGFTDYQKLAALRPYLLTFVSFRNIGYYGKLVMTGPKSDVAKVSDVVSTKGTFYVLAPSDAGGAQTVNRLSTPASPTISQSTGGYIPNAQANYYWLTFSTIWGETTPVAFSLTSNAASVKNTITWTWPTNSAFCIKASIYCANVNDSTQAKLMADVLNGEPAGPTWTDYVGFSGCVISQQPPTANGAYRGQWQQGLWYNETP